MNTILGKNIQINFKIQMFCFKLKKNMVYAIKIKTLYITYGKHTK